ncbi:TIGR00374 family protein, partial [Streptomyces sp. NPDC004542]
MTSPAGLVTGAGRRRAYGHTAVCLAVLTCAVCLARRHWALLETGALRLAVADQGWLLAGVVAAA